MKLLRFFTFYPPLQEVSSDLHTVLRRILDSSDIAKTQSVNHKNALNAVLFEAIQLVIHLDDDKELIRKATDLLGRFISSKETNIRYLGLSSMGKLASLDSETANLVKRHQETVILSLQDPDISIRKRALDLLYGMCDSTNAKAIVSELLSYLVTADYAIREELVLKISILAEKFATHYSWYVDVILQLIYLAGDFVSDDIWYRVIQIVTNHEDIQEYAAKTVFAALQQPNCHETAVKVGGYILGEFGELIAENPKSNVWKQFETLHSKFSNVSLPTKALLLSTYVKFVNLYPEIKGNIRQIFQNHTSYLDAEIQQRAWEYLQLTDGDPKLLNTVWEMMPAFAGRDIVPEEPAPKTEGTSAPVTPKTNSLIDEIFHDIPSATVQTQRQAPSNTLSSLEALLGFDDLVPSPSPRFSRSEPTSFSRAETVSKSPESIQKRIPLGPDGILYQDANIQIGYKSEFKSGRGRIMLFYGNVLSTPLTDVEVSISTVSGLQIEPANIGNMIEPKTQLQQILSLGCYTTFTNIPFLDMTFVANGRHVAVSTPLPLALCKFFEPLSMKGPDFFQNWNKISGEPREQSNIIIKSSTKIDSEWITKLMSLGLHFAILQGVDPNPNNFVGAATFTPLSSQTKTMILLRIETNPTAQMYRCTIKSTEGEVSLGLKHLLKNQLS